MSYPDWEAYRWGDGQGPIVCTYVPTGRGTYQLWWSYIVFPAPENLK